ncbi:hypothetical protein M422DRAFT_263118 [Sphaerobolus stellatus SS14]|uniref:Uncharacterized protein n=1 Tax=Sphaerobolus stellatus (strain SS14) TaxID=990650 RepID=A0A0C9VB98_SPHS4|nr:hypothetical protein M422DRAFT_263118 [Sphaerobolus stellatus SS14]
MHGGPANLHEKMFTQYCCFCVPSRIGFQQKHCPRDHCDVDGKVIHGPVERNIRKVLVMTKPGVPHNHPSYAPKKLSFEAAEPWREAIPVAGPLGKTVGHIMRAPTTAPILTQKSAADPSGFACLARPHYLHKILTEEKQKLYPKGRDFPGDIAQMLGLGRVLLRLNNPKISGIETTDPRIIVIHLSRIID